jgi:ComF family protein
MSVKLFDEWREMRRPVLAQDCFLCGAHSGSRCLCRGCESDMPQLGRSCPQCALPSGSGNGSGIGCGACLRHAADYDLTLAAWRYDFPCDRLLHAFKYRGHLALAHYMASTVADKIDKQVDLIIPMPLHKRRLAERGFNQAVELGRVLARLTRTPMSTQLAKRERDTAPQAGLPHAERQANLRGAFSCRPRLDGMRLAVVDDVMTTGATLNELARTLKRAGAAHIQNWVVARAILN